MRRGNSEAVRVVMNMNKIYKRGKERTKVRWIDHRCNRK